MPPRYTVSAVVVSALVGLLLAWALSQRQEGVPAFDTPSPDAPPQRIICMAPNIAETVFALGAGDRVIAVSEYTVYPPEAAARPSVGAFHNPDLERIAELKPDLIIIQQKHERVEELCARRGIPVMTVDMADLASIFKGIRDLGDRLACPVRAAELIRQIESGLEEVRTRVAGRTPVSVFLGLGRQPGSLRDLYTIGRTGFLAEMLRIAGGRNIYDAIDKEYPNVQIETLLERRPEAIIETYPSQALTLEKRRALIADWQALPSLPAVGNNRIALLTDDYLVVPGPRIALIAQRLAEVLHP